MSLEQVAHNKFQCNLIGFFNKHRQQKSKAQSRSSEKLPEIVNKIYHNTIQVRQQPRRHNRSLSYNQLSEFTPKKVKKGTKLNKYLSSKVDFFNEENQRRLKLKKRKIMIDLGIIRHEKQRVIPSPRKSGLSPSTSQLLQNYLNKKHSEWSKNQNYYVVGRQN